MVKVLKIDDDKNYTLSGKTVRKLLDIVKRNTDKTNITTIDEIIEELQKMGSVGRSQGRNKGEIFSDYQNNKAEARYSSSFGESTTAISEAQQVVGRYNKEDRDALFLVGTGTSQATRKNGLSVERNGAVLFGNASFGKELPAGAKEGQIFFVLED